jgi:membrane glycosyltransferase
MERNPRAGIIQTAPRLINGETLYARLQQFANRLYSPLFLAGLNYWQQSDGNYWGHNAIIRIAPFMDYCCLPGLPGREPFGGRILSHDFVEAALMRKAGWMVWLAYDLEGSYEEARPRCSTAPSATAAGARAISSTVGCWRRAASGRRTVSICSWACSPMRLRRCGCCF